MENRYKEELNYYKDPRETILYNLPIGERHLNNKIKNYSKILSNKEGNKENYKLTNNLFLDNLSNNKISDEELESLLKGKINLLYKEINFFESELKWSQSIDRSPWQYYDPSGKGLEALVDEGKAAYDLASGQAIVNSVELWRDETVTGLRSSTHQRLAQHAHDTIREYMRSRTFDGTAVEEFTEGISPIMAHVITIIEELFPRDQQGRSELGNVYAAYRDEKTPASLFRAFSEYATKIRAREGDIDSISDLIRHMHLLENFAASDAPFTLKTALATSETRPLVPSCINPFNEADPETTLGKHKDAYLQKLLDIRWVDGEIRQIQPMIVLEGFDPYGQYMGAYAQAFLFEADVMGENVLVFDAGVAHTDLYLCPDMDWRHELLMGVVNYAAETGYDTLLVNASVGDSHYSLRDMLLYILNEAQAAGILPEDANYSAKQVRNANDRHSDSPSSLEVEVSARTIYVRKTATDPAIKLKYNMSDRMFAEAFGREMDGERGSVISDGSNIYAIPLDVMSLREHLG